MSDMPDLADDTLCGITAVVMVEEACAVKGKCTESDISRVSVVSFMFLRTPP